MLYYTTNLNLQQVLEMMYINFNALTSADYDSCPKVNLFYGIFKSFSQQHFSPALGFKIF